MSSHHSNKFYATHHRQVDNSRLRKLKAQEARQWEFETERAVIQNEIIAWKLIYAGIIMVGFIATASISITGIRLVF